MLEAGRALRERKVSTRVQRSVDSLDVVEGRFEAEQAQLVVSVQPPHSADL